MKSPRKTRVALVVFPMQMPMIRYAGREGSPGDEENRGRDQAARRGAGQGPGDAQADRRDRGSSTRARGQPALRLPELLPEDEPVDAASTHPEAGVHPYL